MQKGKHYPPTQKFLDRLETVKDFIRLYWTANHYSPSLEDISKHFNVSNAVTTNWIARLEQMKWIEPRKFNVSRNIVPVEIFDGRQVFPEVHRTDDPRADYTVVEPSVSGNEHIVGYKEKE